MFPQAQEVSAYCWFPALTDHTILCKTITTRYIDYLGKCFYKIRDN